MASARGDGALSERTSTGWGDWILRSGERASPPPSLLEALRRAVIESERAKMVPSHFVASQVASGGGEGARWSGSGGAQRAGGERGGRGGADRVVDPSGVGEAMPLLERLGGLISFSAICLDHTCARESCYRGHQISLSAFRPGTRQGMKCHCGFKNLSDHGQSPGQGDLRRAGAWSSDAKWQRTLFAPKSDPTMVWCRGLLVES